MHKEINIKCVFWLPSNPSKRLEGILRFNQELGIEIELFGHFDKYHHLSSKENSILLGVTSDGKDVTLLKCYETSRRFGIPGFDTSSIAALYLFEGKHFNSEDDIMFDFLNIEYENINRWIGISGFDKPIYDSSLNELVVKYTQPKGLSFNINEVWKLKIEFYFFRPGEYFIPTESIEIKQSPEIVFEPASKKSFKEFQEQYSAFNSFLSICYFHYPKINSINFYIETFDDENNKKYEKIFLYFKQGLDYRKYKEYAYREDYLLLFGDMKKNFESHIQRWVHLNNIIHATIDILTEVFMDRKSIMEFHFLSLVQAIENMHRRLIDKKNVALQKRVEAIINRVPKQILDGLSIKSIDFATRVKNNRNHYTHYDERSEKHKEDLSQLYILSEKMKILIIANLMIEIGLTDEEVESIILGKGVYLFNHIIKVKKERNEQT